MIHTPFLKKMELLKVTIKDAIICKDIVDLYEYSLRLTGFYNKNIIIMFAINNIYCMVTKREVKRWIK